MGEIWQRIPAENAGKSAGAKIRETVSLHFQKSERSLPTLLGKYSLIQYAG